MRKTKEHEKLRDLVEGINTVRNEKRKVETKRKKTKRNSENKKKTIKALREVGMSSGVTERRTGWKGPGGRWQCGI
jgi:hypothetical protein